MGISTQRDKKDSEVLVCKDNTFYRQRKNGTSTCKRCSCNKAGHGFNKTVSRVESEHGFLTCYPCDRCPPDTYRELDDKDPDCKPCKLNCLERKRYGSVKCGGASPGHCGDCIYGYQAHSKEPNSYCYSKATEDGSTTPNWTPVPITQLNTSVGKQTFASTAKYAVLFVGGIAVLGILFAIVAAKCNKFHRKRRDRKSQYIAVESTGQLITSKDSSLGFNNDLEIDAWEHRQERVRGERPQSVTINELEALVSPGRKTNLSKRKELKRIYPYRVLDENDDTLTTVADNVYSERRHELFGYLQVEESKTDPEQELWKSGAISFQDYILNVIKLWMQKAGNGATLETLCRALELASFDSIIDKILMLPENRNPPSEHSENGEINTEVKMKIRDDTLLDATADDDAEDAAERAQLYNPSTECHADAVAPDAS